MSLFQHLHRLLKPQRLPPLWLLLLLPVQRPPLLAQWALPKTLPARLAMLPNWLLMPPRCQRSKLFVRKKKPPKGGFFMGDDI